jgi:hypothetical protein
MHCIGLEMDLFKTKAKPLLKKRKLRNTNFLLKIVENCPTLFTYTLQSEYLSICTNNLS